MNCKIFDKDKYISSFSLEHEKELYDIVLNKDDIIKNIIESYFSSRNIDLGLFSHKVENFDDGVVNTYRYYYINNTSEHHLSYEISIFRGLDNYIMINRLKICDHILERDNYNDDYDYTNGNIKNNSENLEGFNGDFSGFDLDIIEYEFIINAVINFEFNNLEFNIRVL